MVELISLHWYAYGALGWNEKWRGAAPGTETTDACSDGTILPFDGSTRKTYVRSNPLSGTMKNLPSGAIGMWCGREWSCSVGCGPGSPSRVTRSDIGPSEPSALTGSAATLPAL